MAAQMDFCPHGRKAGSHGTANCPHGLNFRRTDGKMAARNDLLPHGEGNCPHRPANRPHEAIFFRTESLRTATMPLLTELVIFPKCKTTNMPRRRRFHLFVSPESPPDLRLPKILSRKNHPGRGGVPVPPARGQSESQRDSGTKPSVARHALPWVSVFEFGFVCLAWFAV
jgi:hypothetical protein